MIQLRGGAGRGGAGRGGAGRGGAGRGGAGRGGAGRGGPNDTVAGRVRAQLFSARAVCLFVCTVCAYYLVNILITLLKALIICHCFVVLPCQL